MANEEQTATEEQRANVELALKALNTTERLFQALDRYETSDEAFKRANADADAIAEQLEGLLRELCQASGIDPDTLPGYRDAASTNQVMNERTGEFLPGASRREREAKLRSYGEQGWCFGFDPLRMDDQFAYLGELVVQVANMERDPELRADIEDDGRGMTIADLKERIERETFELGSLDEMPEWTREQCLEVEAKYDAWKAQQETNFDAVARLAAAEDIADALVEPDQE